MKFQNASQEPKIYYGLHMVEGVCQYKHKNVNEGKPYLVLVGEKCLKEMDSSFPGKPVFVRHVDDVDWENIQRDADGWVSDSFYNKADGKYWCKFIVISDEGHEAIKKGWKLSNCYTPTELGSGGKCHAVEYLKEVLKGKYDHLAIVPDPRYEESIILTPDQFKAYNSEKELELKRLENSNDEENEMKFKFWKEAKIENTAALDFATTMVRLEKAKRDVSIEQLLNEADVEKKAEPAAKDCYANGEHKVKVGEEEMTVNELVDRHNKMKDALNGGGQDEKQEPELANDAAKALEEKKANEAKELADKKANEDKAAMEKKANAKTNYEKLMNGGLNEVITDEQKVETSQTQLARGQKLFGSSKKK